MNNDIKDAVDTAMVAAQEKGLQQELVAFMIHIQELDLLEVYGVARIMGINLSGGNANLDGRLIELMREKGLSEDLDYLAAKANFKQFSQILNESFAAFLELSDNQRDNLMSLLEDATAAEGDECDE